MDLTTKYLGLTLRSPICAAASPLSEDLDAIRNLDEAGCGAIVMHSLFEEQLEADKHQLKAMAHYMDLDANSHPEAMGYFPDLELLSSGPEQYLEEIRRVKEAVEMPVIGSLNGNSKGGWIDFSKQIEQAGADAIELNIFYLNTDFEKTGNAIEDNYVGVVKAVKDAITIPVAVKLHPYFSSLPNMAKRLVDAGADGLVLFNRFYQPDIDLEYLEARPSLSLSHPAESLLPMRWIALLHGRVEASLAATTGIHSATDVAKMLLAGADTVMLASVLLRRGAGFVGVLNEKLVEWCEQAGIEDLGAMRGRLSQRSCPDPQTFERANYIKTIATIR